MHCRNLEIFSNLRKIVKSLSSAKIDSHGKNSSSNDKKINLAII